MTGDMKFFAQSASLKRRMIGKDNTNLVLFLVCAVAFAFLFLRYWWFVLDDAFVTFRYALNLAEHGQPTWDIHLDPVEGYTSFLWVLLNAAAIKLGLDPIVFSKVISLLSALYIIGILTALTSRLQLFWRISVLSAFAMSPTIALLAAQGMETVLTCALLLTSAALSSRVLSRRDDMTAVAWFAVAFLAALSRPDTVFFSAGVIFGIVLLLPLNRVDIRRFALLGVPFVVAGVIYMTWRYNYFGYLLPNPGYIKLHAGMSISYLASFVVRILPPYLILGGVSLYFVRKLRSIVETAPVLFGVIFFLVYLLSIVPIQGHLWRYAYPIMGPILFIVVVWAHSFPIERSRYSAGAQVLLICFCVAWSMRHLPLADRESQGRTQVDRVRVARSLHGLNGTMYTTEAGAPAYFSGWRAVDHLGLNSEEIAHRTITRRAVLEDLEPDIVMLLIEEYYEPTAQMEVFQYLMDENYAAAAAVHKFGKKHHLYFVRRESALCKEVTRRLLAVGGVKYGDLRSIMTNATAFYVASESEKSETYGVCR